MDSKAMLCGFGCWTIFKKPQHCSFKVNDCSIKAFRSFELAIQRMTMVSLPQHPPPLRYLFGIVLCPDPTHFVEQGLVTFAGVLGPTPFSLSGQSDVLIQVYCDLIGYIEENGQLNNMAVGQKCGVSHQTLLNEVGGV